MKRRLLSQPALLAAVVIFAHTACFNEQCDRFIEYGLIQGFDDWSWQAALAEDPARVNGNSLVKKVPENCEKQIDGTSDLLLLFSRGLAIRDEEGGAWHQAQGVTRNGESREVTAVDCADPLRKGVGVGTDSGFYVVDIFTGELRQATGLPRPQIRRSLAGNSTAAEPYVSAVLAEGASFLVGTSPRTAGVKLLSRCVASTAVCTPIAGAPTTLNQFDSAIAFARFGSKILLGSTLGVHVSTDGGTTWGGTTGVQNYGYEFAVVNGIAYVVTGAGVFRSSDGTTWTPFSDGLGSFPFGTALVASGQTLYTSSNMPKAGVFQRNVSDASWHDTAPISTARVQSLAVNSKSLYAGTTGGVYRLQAGAWVPANEGLFFSANYATAFAQDGKVFLGGSFTNHAIASTPDEGLTWRYAADNLAITSFAAVGSTVFAGGPAGLQRSTDGGATFQKLTVAGVPSGTAFGPVAASGSRLLAGVFGAVYATTDGGASFKPSSAGLDSTAGVNWLASSGSDVAAATTKGLFVSHDAGQTWTKAPLPSGGVSWVGFPANGRTLYVAPTDSTTPLLRTEDFGVTLTQISNGLPQAIVNAVALDPASARLFVGSAGLFSSTDGGATWSRFSSKLATTPVTGLAVSGNHLWVATDGLGSRTYILVPRTVRFVPIVLDVDTGSAHFTSELSIPNRGTSPATVTMKYTASLGSGSGTVVDTIAAGKQLYLPDVLSYLREKGLTIPQGGSQGGTLLLSFEGVSSPDVVSAVARTTAATGSPQPVGRAGLAYSAVGPVGSSGTLMLYGLRSTPADRSNLAVYNVSSEPVTLEVTVFSGAGDGRSAVLAAADTLPPYGWKQYNRVLDGVGYTNGWARVRRVSGNGTFGAYAVINDNATNDGSFVTSVIPVDTLPFLNVPVLVETPTFGTELLLADSADAPATLVLTYRESLTGTATGSTTLVLQPHTQLIQPDAIAFLRQRGIPIGPTGAASYAGSLHVEISGVSPASVFAGARTSSYAPGGGQFGVFTPAFEPGTEQLDAAWVYGLRADAASRSNVAAVNVGGAEAGSITLSVQAYDGDAGGVAKGAAVSLTLAPGQWAQLSGFLGNQGVANGWVKLTRVSGTAPWIAYGVINDGGGPGQATGDGAFIPFTP
jgi:hypothetical protein